MQICKLKMLKHYPGVHEEVFRMGVASAMGCSDEFKSYDINLTTLSYLIPTWRGGGMLKLVGHAPNLNGYNCILITVI